MHVSWNELVFAGVVSSASYFLTDWTISVLFQKQRDIAYSQTMDSVLEYLEHSDSHESSETPTGIQEVESIGNSHERLIYSVNTILESTLLNQHETETMLRKQILVQSLGTYFISCGVWYITKLIL